MKTITITITVQEETCQTIKGSIMEQVAIAKANQALANKQISARVHEMFKIREELMQQMNETVGADVWFVKNFDVNSYNPTISRKHKHFQSADQCFAVKIGFSDGIYRNTPYNDWDLYIQTPLKGEVKYGEIKYNEPNLDIIEMYLVKSNHNQTFRMGDSDKISYKIEDINEVHKHLEKDYITYFTKGN